MAAAAAGVAPAETEREYAGIADVWPWRAASQASSHCDPPTPSSRARSSIATSSADDSVSIRFSRSAYGRCIGILQAIKFVVRYRQVSRYQTVSMAVKLRYFVVSEVLFGC